MKMSLAGIGFWFALYSILASIPLLYLQYNYFKPFGKDTLINEVIGLLLIVIGILLIMYSGKTIRNCYYKDILCTNGPYKIVRNPLYATWTFIMVPALSIFLGYYLLFILPIIMVILLKLMLKKEEDYLSNKFGDLYLLYKSQVPQIFPKLFIKHQKR